MSYVIKIRGPTSESEFTVTKEKYDKILDLLYKKAGNIS